VSSHAILGLKTGRGVPNIMRRPSKKAEPKPTIKDLLARLASEIEQAGELLETAGFRSHAKELYRAAEGVEGVQTDFARPGIA
jgi:hypothetical protein